MFFVFLIAVKFKILTFELHIYSRLDKNLRKNI